MIALPVLPALRMFSHAVTCYDETVASVKGRPARTVGEDYVISGSFQPAGPKVLRLLPEGVSAAGVRVLKTERTLRYIDTGEGATSGVQTYIKFNGETWRVMQVLDWKLQGGFNGYIAEKFLRQGA